LQPKDILKKIARPLPKPPARAGQALPREGGAFKVHKGYHEVTQRDFETASICE